MERALKLCNANNIATTMLFLKFSQNNVLDKLMKGNGFLMYARGSWNKLPHKLKQALNMTLQNEIIQKVNALCSVQRNVLQDFLIFQIMLLSCFTMCGRLHIYTGKAIAFYKRNK